MEILKRVLVELNIPHDSNTLETFETYRDMVLEWNQKVNLTGIKDPRDFEIRHFIDSLLCVAFPPFLEAKSIIDVGTGAGFPGVPLAICYPEKQFLLMDSLQKRMRILNEMVDELGLSNVTVMAGRAEDIARSTEHRERYDICLSRAVAHLSTLSEYCLPFVREGGYFGAYKTADNEKEYNESKRAIMALGGSFYENIVHKVEEALPDHYIMWIKKAKATPVTYPRRAGLPSKEPIR